ncbi:gag poly [Fusarium coicis]|nr:gag poly [Fusarium coicis]
MDEKRIAEMKIRQLKQRGSAADYLAEYRYQAAKLNWGEEAHMAQVYLGLKSEVKDAMANVRPKPANLIELAHIAVEIDNQQYERRREKQAEKQGGSYNPRWNTNRQNANQGRKRTNDTSYGTEAGPMTIGVTKKDKSKITCWNCGKKGNYDQECKNPVKTNQKYRPVPEGKKQVNSVHKDEEPQMAVRSVNMTRKDGYDTGKTPYIRNLNLEIPYRSSPEERRTRTNKNKKKLYYKNKENKTHNQEWMPVPETTHDKENDKTIRMVRKGKEVAPNPDDEPSTPEFDQKLDNALAQIFTKSGAPVKIQGGTIQHDPYSTVDDIPVRTTAIRPNRHYGDPNYTSASRTVQDLETMKIRR